METNLDSEMQVLFAAMSSKSDQLIDDRRTNTGTGSNNHNGGPRITQAGLGTSRSMAPKVAKLNFPQYGSNEDPTSWICQVELFFKFHGTNEDERLPFVAYHLDNDAQLWFQLYREGETSEVTQEALKKGLHAKYGSTLFQFFFFF
jgi:hypothetical protein